MQLVRAVRLRAVMATLRLSAKTIRWLEKETGCGLRTPWKGARLDIRVELTDGWILTNAEIGIPPTERDKAYGLAEPAD